MRTEIVDNWTVAQAWEETYGKARRPSPHDVPEDSLCELDAVVADYFEDDSVEGRKKASAALQYLFPRLVLSQLPPGPKRRQRQHIASVVTDAVRDYCREDGIPETGWRNIARAFRRWELRSLDSDDWYLVWDAIGTSGANSKDMLMWDFYKFAGAHVRYSNWE